MHVAGQCSGRYTAVWARVCQARLWDLRDRACLEERVKSQQTDTLAKIRPIDLPAETIGAVQVSLIRKYKIYTHHSRLGHSSIVTPRPCLRKQDMHVYFVTHRAE